jgi:hypothetical protein
MNSFSNLPALPKSTGSSPEMRSFGNDAKLLNPSYKKKLEYGSPDRGFLSDQKLRIPRALEPISAKPHLPALTYSPVQDQSPPNIRNLSTPLPNTVQNF